MAGRHAKSKSLAVWMNGERVGQWTFASGGSYSFAYEAAWLDHPQGRPLSLSLPLTQGTKPYIGSRVETYFDNPGYPANWNG